MKKIRWGILSTAKIGLEKVIPAMQKSQYCEIVAIASRSRNQAERAALKLNIPKYYGTYENLLADPDIDAIYNPLPNHLHVPWSVRALEAGKHVLCEKPIALSAEEAEALLNTTQRYPQLKIMEAFMYRFHPQWLHAKSWIEEGKIGELRTIQSFFSYYNIDPDNIRNKADMGGGGLMDIGCYSISLSRFLFNSEPNQVTGMLDMDPRFQTDRMASGILKFQNGTSLFTCSTQIDSYQRVHIFGTRGHIEIKIPFNAPNDQPCHIYLQTCSGMEKATFEICDQYTLQGDQFSLSILNNTGVPTPLVDAVFNMRVIDAVRQSSNTLLTVTL